MRERARNVGVYLASTNWTQLAGLVLAGGATFKYVEPWLVTVVLPAVWHHWLRAKAMGVRAIAEAAYLQAFQGASREKAEKWAEEEGKG